MSSRAIRRAATMVGAAALLGVSAASAAGTGDSAGAAGASTTTPTTTTPYNVTGVKYTLSFSPNKPLLSSSWTITLVSPSQPTSVAVAVPAGVRLNLRSVPLCAAPPACDPSTQVGAGTASVHYSQYVIPLNFSVFNIAGGLAVVISNPQGSPVVVKPTWSGGVLTIPYPNGYYKGVAIQVAQISLTFYKLGTGRNAFLRTPTRCTKAGWPSTGTFTFPNGTTAPAKGTAKCQTAKKKKKKHKRPKR